MRDEDEDTEDEDWDEEEDFEEEEWQKHECNIEHFCVLSLPYILKHFQALLLSSRL